MKTSTKISILAAILIADLFFFLFMGVYYPSIFNAILQMLPWQDNLEKAVAVILGFIIAVTSSWAIIRTILKSMQRKE